jgi:hypothetical protein
MAEAVVPTLDIVIPAGEDYEEVVHFNDLNAAGAVANDTNWTGWTNFFGEIKAAPDAAGQAFTAPIAKFAVTIEGTASNGDLKLTMLKAVTSALQTAPGAALRSDGKVNGTYDVFGDDTTPRRKKVLRGRWSLQLQTTTDFS